MPPTVTSWGEWIGGLWPDDCWRREWIAAWAAIGWHAASALTLLDVSMREWKDRAELVETDLAKARDIIKAFMRGASLEPPGLFERAAALLAKVKL